MGEIVRSSDNSSAARTMDQGSSGQAFLNEVNGIKPHKPQPEKPEPPKDLAVVCDGKTCVPFSTVDSGKSNAAAFLNENFQIFDRNGNNFVDNKELGYWRNKFAESSTDNTDNNANARRMTDRLMHNSQRVANLINDEFGPENDGITVKDLEAVLKMAEKSPGSLSKENKSLLEALGWRAKEKKS